MPGRYLPTRFEDAQLIGMGTGALVFRAYDSATDACVAVKQLHRRRMDEAESVQRFTREVELMAKMSHPAVLPVLDCDIGCRQPWFSTDLCEKGSLADIVVRGVVPVSSLLVYALEVLDALSYIHDFGVVHRDIKPENVLIDASDAARVADFGISHSPFHAQTDVADRLGTPSFSAPEQRLNPTLATPQSDLYSLGATLYVCQQRRTAVPLLQARSRRSVIERVPQPLRDIVRRSTSLDPSARYRSADEMADAVASALEVV